MKYIFFICFSLFSSCTKHKEENDKEVTNNNIENQNIENKQLAKSTSECLLDSIKMQITEYGGIKFYSENKLRGSGVLALIMPDNVDILNTDKTFYGSIILGNNTEEPYNIKLPKVIVAREIIPDVEHRIFSFDAEQPETDKDFLIVYLNKEKKLISKKASKYKFSSWETYIKSSFIHLTSKIENSTKEEQMYYYQSIKIKGDSMQIKSVSKTSCDYVEEYKNVTKWIKWKNDSCKFIMFDFCY
ncbi:hypothetical protein [Pseudomonas shirazensis]